MGGAGERWEGQGKVGGAGKGGRGRGKVGGAGQRVNTNG